MKKLNKKGIGQHLLLVIIAVVAVVGVAGYFVWQRQKNNDLEAKAAGYPDLAKISYGTKGSSQSTLPKVTFSGCKRMDASGDNYYVNIYAIRGVTNKGVEVAIGYNRVGKKITTTKTRSWSGNIIALPKFKAQKNDEGWYGSYALSGGGYSESKYLIKNLPNCY